MIAELITKAVEVKIEDRVLHITLNRPKAFNAISQEMVSELTEIFNGLERMDVRAVVLRGAGGNFCAGADVKEMSTLIEHSKAGDLDAIAKHNQSAGMLFTLIDEAPYPVIAVLEGSVLGGGMGFCCAADIAIAKSNAVFGLPETCLGLIPAQISPFVRRRLGESNARLMAVEGGRIDAVRAERLGLVHYLVADDVELESTLNAVLKKVKACAPKALACAKQLMVGKAPIESCEPEALGMLFAKHMASDEGKEGTSAFIEKRTPAWNQ